MTTWWLDSKSNRKTPSKDEIMQKVEEMKQKDEKPKEGEEKAAEAKQLFFFPQWISHSLKNFSSSPVSKCTNQNTKSIQSYTFTLHKLLPTKKIKFIKAFV